MTDVRFQPASAPRSTGIPRSTSITSRPTGSGQTVQSSSAAPEPTRAHAAANAPTAGRLPQQPRPTAPGVASLTTDEILLVGELVHRNKDGLEPAQLELAEAALEKLGREIEIRQTASARPPANANPGQAGRTKSVNKFGT